MLTENYNTCFILFHILMKSKDVPFFIIITQRLEVMVGIIVLRIATSDCFIFVLYHTNTSMS